MQIVSSEAYPYNLTSNEIIVKEYVVLSIVSTKPDRTDYYIKEKNSVDFKYCQSIPAKTGTYEEDREFINYNIIAWIKEYCE